MGGEFLRRVWYLIHRRRLERELAEEMAAHRERMGDGAAFGNTLRLREESADVWGWQWLDAAWQDLRFAARTLKPGFLITAGLVLSLGIGLNLALFQLVNEALVRPPAVKDPATFVRLTRHGPSMSNSQMPYPAIEFVRANNSAFSAMPARVRAELMWEEDAGDRVPAAFVSGGWFEEAGHGAALGRTLSREIDGKPGAAPAAVISDKLWRVRLGADAAAVGRTIRLNDRPVTVAGVLRSNYPSMKGEVVDVWLDMEQYAYLHPGGDPGNQWVSNNAEAYGRLGPGISVTAAREATRASMKALAQVRPVEFAPDEWLEPITARELFREGAERERIRVVVMLIGALTLLVLLVACSNVGNLLLSRAAVRAREFSVRVAMGASRWRLMRQMLMESLLLALAGAMGGILLAVWGCRVLAAQLDLPGSMSFDPDVPMLVAALGCGVLTALAAGLAPAWRASRCNLAASMKDGGQQNSAGLERTRLRQLLLAAQVAASCLLLVIAGLMVDGARRILSEDHGFAYAQVAAVNPGLSRYGLKGAEGRAWWEKMRAAVLAIPEAENAAIVSMQPLGRVSATSRFPEAPRLGATVLAIDGRFLDVMGVKLLSGRAFGPGDDHRTAVIISRRLAQAMYGTVEVVGKGFPKNNPDRTIVGVTADAPMVKIEANDLAEMYVPLKADDYSEYVMVVKARMQAAALLGPLRSAARSADDRVLASAVTLSSELDRRMESTRLASLIFALTGLAALALACVGIYGVVSFGAATRTKEIGIRLALGSPGRGIIGLLLREQAWPLAAGLVIGLAGAKALSGPMSGEPIYLRAMGYEVPALVVALFAVTGAAAIIAPSLRVLRMDPVRALREE